MARNKFDVDENLESPFNIVHLKRAFKYIKKQRKRMLTAFLLSALASVAGLCVPKITQWVLDEAVPNKDVNMLFRMAALFIILISVSIVFNVLRSRIMAHASQEIIYDIRKDLF